jgi:ferritin
MQAPSPPTNVVLDVLRSPAVVIGACAVFVRWVMAPAVTNYMRHELQEELSKLAQFPLFVERVKTLEIAIEKLSVVPEALARIEEQVATLHQERRVTKIDRRLDA